MPAAPEPGQPNGASPTPSSSSAATRWTRARWAALDRPDALVIAADSGYDHAVAAGLHPDVLVGDLDSISRRPGRARGAAGLTIDAHPADKEATDTELALDRAGRDRRRRPL